MKASLLALALLSYAPDTSHARYQRSVTVPGAGVACAALDPALYAHAAGSLADLRLRTADGRQEIPYVLTLSQAATGEPLPAQVQNLRQLGRTLVFDLVMPPRPYTDVKLNLAAQNFVAVAVVTAGAHPAEQLGSYTLFDLADRHLSRNTTVPLQESTYPVLHVRLVPSIDSQPFTSAAVQGATVPPSREAQTLYTPALRSDRLVQTATQTAAAFQLPARLPIERIRFELDPASTASFLREVRISSHAIGDPQNAGEQVTGTISRVHLSRDGVAIRAESLTLPATLGANLQGAAEAQVTILNGAEPPLPLRAVVLETRQRQLCFAAPAGNDHGVTLFYGDLRAEAPRYDFARTFRAGATVLQASLGPEQLNPAFKPRGDDRRLLRRHPRLLYLGSILLICLMATLALRSSKLRL